MNIVIGEAVRIGPAAQYRPDGESVSVEARLLEIRDRGQTAGSGSAVSGRIITLLSPKGKRFPVASNPGTTASTSNSCIAARPGSSSSPSGNPG